MLHILQAVKSPIFLRQQAFVHDLTLLAVVQSRYLMNILETIVNECNFEPRKQSCQIKNT